MDKEFVVGKHVIRVNGMPHPTSVYVTGSWGAISVYFYKVWWRNRHFGTFEDYVRSHSIPRDVADKIVSLFSWMKTPDNRPSRYYNS